MQIDCEPAVLATDPKVPPGESTPAIERDRTFPSPDSSCGRTRQAGRQSVLSGFLLIAYRHAGSRVRALVRRVAAALEGGECYSSTLRRILADVHHVEIGLYTHGGCFIPGHLPPKTKIGRYSSIAVTAVAFGRNHPLNLQSTHAFFFNPKLGIAPDEIVAFNSLSIGNDVWIGHNAIIMPSVSSIGDGAVIAAGSVVHKNIPPYAIVTGNPARVVRFRFSEPMIEALRTSCWWREPVTTLSSRLREFQQPLEGGSVR